MLTLVLAGGRGDRLRPLTLGRAKPVVPFAGRRILDFTLLNCLRSEFEDVVVLVQYEASSIAQHLRASWQGRFATLGTFSSEDTKEPFRGTADAVRALLARNPDCDRLLVLAGDHVYRMDYRRLLAEHRAVQAAATLSAVPVHIEEACHLGVLAVGGEGLVEAFVEKPDAPPAIPGRPDVALASMGIYVFERDVLQDFFDRRPDATDFGHHVVPGLLEEGHRLAVHDFATQGEGYWRDIADLDAYHGALMDVVRGYFDPGDDWPTALERATPTRFLKGPGGSAPGVACDSWIGPGTTIQGGTVDTSVVGAGVTVEHHAEVVESVLLDNVVVGAHARLRRVVVEEGVRIPAGAVLGYPPHGGDLSWLTRGGVTFIGRVRAPQPTPQSTS